MWLETMWLETMWLEIPPRERGFKCLSVPNGDYGSASAVLYLVPTRWMSMLVTEMEVGTQQ